MRQAGRYLPEYREVRRRVPSFLELCYTPALAAEVTLQPVRRFGMDAAILFSDILVIPDALGCATTFVEGEGPKLDAVVDGTAVARLDPDRVLSRLAPVYEAVARVRSALSDAKALIGFAGAPWTVAAYMVEGGSAPEFYGARTLARREPETFARLIDILVAATTEHLAAQIDAGADALQLFDSWAGILPEPEFARWCVAPAARIVTELKSRYPDVPVIAFPRGAGASYLRYAREVPIDGLSLDTTVPLLWARDHFDGVCLQGNLDPVALLARPEEACAEARRIVDQLGGRPFIFNLGHGVLPQTDPATVGAVVETVRGLGSSASRPSGAESTA